MKRFWIIVLRDGFYRSNDGLIQCILFMKKKNCVHMVAPHLFCPCDDPSFAGKTSFSTETAMLLGFS